MAPVRPSMPGRGPGQLPSTPPAASKLSASNLSHASTPSIIESADRTSSSGSSSPALLCGSPESLKQSLSLAMGQPDQSYVKEAKQMLTDRLETLEAEINEPAFTHAMVRQGVEKVDLGPDSRLSGERQVGLLAAVLQDKEIHRLALSSELPIPARTLRHQVQQKFDMSLEKTARNSETRDRATQHKEALSQAARARSEERFSLDQARTERLKARGEAHSRERRQRAASKEAHRIRICDQGDSRLSKRVSDQQAVLSAKEERLEKQLQTLAAAEEQRRAQCQEKGDMWEARVEHGAEQLSERAADRQAFLDEQENRLNKSLEQLQMQKDQARERLQSRFVLVQQGCENAQQDLETRMQSLHESLQQKLRQSDVHQQKLREDAEDRRQIREGTRIDREHQRDRMIRVKEYQRCQISAAVAEDTETFENCRRLQERMRAELSQRAIESAVMD